MTQRPLYKMGNRALAEAIAAAYRDVDSLLRVAEVLPADGEPVPMVPVPYLDEESRWPDMALHVWPRDREPVVIYHPDRERIREVDSAGVPGRLYWLPEWAAQRFGPAWARLARLAAEAILRADIQARRRGGNGFGRWSRPESPMSACARLLGGWDGPVVAQVWAGDRSATVQPGVLP